MKKLFVIALLAFFVFNLPCSVWAQLGYRIQGGALNPLGITNPTIDLGDINPGPLPTVLLITLEQDGGSAYFMEAATLSNTTEWSKSHPSIPASPGIQIAAPITFEIQVSLAPIPSDLADDLVYSTNLTIQNTDGASVISIEATGKALKPNLVWSPSAGAFGAISSQPLSNSGDETITLTNSGNADLVITDISPSDTHFTLTPVGNSFPLTIVPGGTQDILVTLTVDASLTTEVFYSGDLAVTSNDVPKSIPVFGTGQPFVSDLDITSSYWTINFSEVELDQIVSAVIKTENNGLDVANVLISKADVSDPDWEYFKVTVPTVGEVNETTNSQTYDISTADVDLGVEFDPGNDGDFSVSLNIIDQNDPASQLFSITINGNAVLKPMDFVLTMDCSGSMGGAIGNDLATGQPVTKIQAVQRAAAEFTSILGIMASINNEYEYNLGLVAYDGTVYEKLAILPANETTTITQASTALQELEPGGNTCIADAMIYSGNMLTSFAPSDEHNQVMVVLTDGMEVLPCSEQLGTFSGVYPGPPSKDIHYFSVGLGLEGSNLNSTTINTIADYGTNPGDGLLIADMNGVDFSLLADFYRSVFEKATGRDVTGTVYSRVGSQWLDVPIKIVSSDKDALFSFDGQYPESYYQIQLITPKGVLVTEPGTIDGITLAMDRKDNWALYGANFANADPADYAGTWRMRARLSTSEKEILARGQHYIDISASVKSSYRLIPVLVPGMVNLGTPLDLVFSLKDDGRPSPGAKVTATITKPDGTLVARDLPQNSYDGLYKTQFADTYENGLYHLEITVDGFTRSGERVRRHYDDQVFVGKSAVLPVQSDTMLSTNHLIWIIIVLLLITMILIVRRRNQP